ncbi:MAG: hypothetical protein AAFN79_06340 [Pseudomonadota bacterium]
MTEYPRSLAGRIAYAWSAPAASWRAEWSGPPPESRLIALAFGAALFLTLGPVAAEAIRPTLALGEERAPWFAARLLIGFSFLPLALYLVAALFALICKVFRGAAPGDGGSWKACRLALFWSALASGPAAAVTYAVGAAINAPEAASLVAGVLWAGLLAPMLAAAQGFPLYRVAIVFAALAVAATIASIGS